MELRGFVRCLLNRHEKIEGFLGVLTNQNDRMGLGEAGNIAHTMKLPFTLMVHGIGYAPKIGSC